MFNQGVTTALTPELTEALRSRAHSLRVAAITATSVAGSGHPGGSMSSAEIYTALYSLARLRPDEPRWENRDRIVVSHGHTSPGVYAALANAGFFPMKEFVAHFRQAGSPFEGHVERMVPGVECSTGNLGQGLSAGVGFALGARLKGEDWHTFVAMSDGEQHKGQVGEARRLAAKEGLANVTAVIDCNGVQISGHTVDVMPVRIAADWAADGWRVIECDGHDVAALCSALADAASDDVPTVVVARTVIGKGVSFMEDEPEFHGRGLNAEEYVRAMSELGADADIEVVREHRTRPLGVAPMPVQTGAIDLDPGRPRTYASDVVTDNRSAWGAALADLAETNPGLRMAVLDCDLMTSVKTDAFRAVRPRGFVQCGVGEHNAATVAGALSIVPGILAFWSDFGVFGLDEVYNQQRLNDINGANVKVAVTHCGLDVGEDGRTHQCIDYVGALKCFFGWRLVVPADPNQTDRAVRAAAMMAGPVAIAMGRSKLHVIRDASGEPSFGDGYSFEYGRIEWVREGADATLLTMGTVASACVTAADRLARDGLRVGVGIVACPLDLDEEAMHRAVLSRVLLTVEDHSVRSGLGASVAEWCGANGISVRLHRLGVEEYSTSGTSAEVLALAGLDAAGIERRLRAILE